MNGRFLKEKKTNPLHETLVALKILLIKAHGSEDGKKFSHLDLEYLTNVFWYRDPQIKILYSILLKTIM